MLSSGMQAVFSCLNVKMSALIVILSAFLRWYEGCIFIGVRKKKYRRFKICIETVGYRKFSMTSLIM